YWLMMSMGAVIAVYQLIFKPHFWEKTIHGLHLVHEESLKEREILRLASRSTGASRLQRLADLVRSKQILGGGALVFASLLSNIMNFLYNAYLGRHANLVDFGVISLIGSFLYITHVPFGSFSKTMTHTSAYLLGQYQTPVREFWIATRKNTIKWSFAIAVLWLLASPALNTFFHTQSLIPYILFTPVWMLGALLAVDGGFLGGNLKFPQLAIISVSEALSKLLFSYAFVQLGLTGYVYASVPLSMIISFSLAWLLARRIRATKEVSLPQSAFRMPKKFFATSILLSLSSITFLSMDLLLAKHYLSPANAGSYSFLTLAGKMVFFLSSIFGQFTVPLISRDVGAGKKSRIFGKLLMLIIGINFLGFLVFGVFGFVTVPLLWGPNTASIIPYLPIYTLAMACYSLSGFIITYRQIRRQYAFPIAGFIFSLIQVLGMYLFHNSIATLTTVIAVSAFISLAGIVVLHLFYDKLKTVYKNLLDLFGLFSKLPVPSVEENGKLRILVFNWRDTKHKWSGGAEVYIHELARRWVAMGHKVTVFCGNDQDSRRYETISGVWVIRRGGFYTVYIWAFLYYMRHLRGKYDIIIDSENGLPFFTPLYAREKVYLLIHHVHQEVFRKTLKPPFSWLAQALERRVMPIVYRNTEVITVSPSSKSAILENCLTKKDPHVIYNGVDLDLCKPGRKSQHPTVLYLGRLTTAKSLYVLIEAAKKIRKWVPQVTITIAGDGPDRERLKKLTQKLGVDEFVIFVGKVTETVKVSLYQRTWIFVNPSLIEGWGITTIEANACGTPVVASNVAGLRDAVHNPYSGLLIPYGNVDEFASNITKLLIETKTRQLMSNESIEWAKKFDWDKSANKSIEIFQA
ncbi:MAG: glycosyltransferase, partial [Patescibacteria group bacterium]